MTGFAKVICILFLVVANCWQTSVAESSKNLTSPQHQALKRFRSLVEPELYRDFMRNDLYLWRWLRDQNYNVERARTKLLSSLKWRKENRIDDLAKEDFSDVAKICPYSLDAHDKIGRPVLTTSVGGCPVRRIILNGQGEKYRRYNYQSLEELDNALRKAESNGTGIVDAIGIVDLSGFNWREHACLPCIPYETENLITFENHYPQFFYLYVMINAPRIFENFLALLRPLLSEQTQRGIRVYGFNKQEWQKELLKHIDADQLQPKYGGTKNRKILRPT